MRPEQACPPPSEDVVALGTSALDDLMPMHLWVGPTGHIRSTGRTIAKLAKAETLVGTRLLEVLEVRRPRRVPKFADLIDLSGQRLSVVLRHMPEMSLKGIVVALPDGGGALLNFSFGINAVAAVSRHGLKLTDFAPSDLTVEMLYLMEAKSAALNESKRLNARLQTAKSEAEERSLTDTLTGLRNRRAMDHALDLLTRSAAPDQFGLMQIDLDYFKAVNDTLGHAAGDRVLAEVATILRQETRTDDIVARVGGDEFVLILHRCNDPGLLSKIAERIISRLNEPILHDGQPCRISASIGITLSSQYATPDPDQMLLDADAATYISKRNGRSQFTVHRQCVSDATASGGPGA